MTDSTPPNQPHTLQASVCDRFKFILEVAYKSLQENKLDDIVSEFWWQNFDELHAKCKDLNPTEQTWFDAITAYRKSKS